VAVRAPHDALGDLVSEALQRHLSIDQVRDVRGLGADVIEVEYGSVGLTAVRARRSAQDVIDIGRVTRAALADHGRGAAALDRTSPVATGAHHLAERQLFVQAGRSRPEVGKLSESHPLSPDMVELEKDGVALAAVGARVRHEIGEQVRLGAQTPAGQGSAGLRAVQIAARAEVLPGTTPASVLTAPEQGGGEHETAPPAAPPVAKVGNRKPAPSELLGARGLETPCGRWRLPGPRACRADSDTEGLRDGAQRCPLCPEPPCGLLFGCLSAHGSMLASTPERSAHNLAAWIVL
jgi:hypothetical protein